jgi:hypothetical protein
MASDSPDKASYIYNSQLVSINRKPRHEKDCANTSRMRLLYIISRTIRTAIMQSDLRFQPLAMLPLVQQERRSRSS